jgi:hypothetical protein
LPGQGSLEERTAWFEERLPHGSWLPCANDALGRPTAAMDYAEYTPKYESEVRKRIIGFHFLAAEHNCSLW